MKFIPTMKSFLNLYVVILLDLFIINYRADSRFAPSQWETSLQRNAVSHWLGANLDSALQLINFALCLYIYFCQTVNNQARNNI